MIINNINNNNNNNNNENIKNILITLKCLTERCKMDNNAGYLYSTISTHFYESLVSLEDIYYDNINLIIMGRKGEGGGGGGEGVEGGGVVTVIV